MKTRPFKFRAFVKAEKTMIYNINNIKINNNGEIESFTFGEGKRVFQIERYPENINALEKTHIDFEIMQFIGQQDLYEKEIYEGDIVKSWLQGKELDFEIDIITDIRKSIILMSGHSFDNSWLLFEIIGNIYEHPQLLEKNNG